MRRFWAWLRYYRWMPGWLYVWVFYKVGARLTYLIALAFGWERTWRTRWFNDPCYRGSFYWSAEKSGGKRRLTECTFRWGKLI